MSSTVLKCVNISIMGSSLYRAILEGLSYQFRLTIELSEKTYNIRFPNTKVVRGGSKIIFGISSVLI